VDILLKWAGLGGLHFNIPTLGGLGFHKLEHRKASLGQVFHIEIWAGSGLNKSAHAELYLCS